MPDWLPARFVHGPRRSLRGQSARRPGRDAFRSRGSSVDGQASSISAVCHSNSVPCGDSYDNALAETINGLYKAEVIWRQGLWRSFETVEYATLEWVDWFNNRRLLEPIGNVPPAEAEAAYYASLEEPAAIAA